MSATHVNDQNFESDVRHSDRLVLVDFHATWCGPCRQMGPIVDEVAEELGDTVKVVKANVDESPSAASAFGIQSIPAFVLLQDGEVKEQFSGAASKETLLQFVAKHRIQPS